jgi:3'-phosphoadenosine 5'-phosphosulfate sulfotransferase
LTPEQAEYKKRYKGVKDLEKLCGGFNIKLKTLQNPRKRAKIVTVIRQCADCMDEVVRIIEQGVQEA